MRTFSNAGLSIITLDEFINSDDNQIYEYIKKIVSDTSTEPILRHWCTCFLKRKIPKLIPPPIKRSDGKKKLDEYIKEKDSIFKSIASKVKSITGHSDFDELFLLKESQNRDVYKYNSKSFDKLRIKIEQSKIGVDRSEDEELISDAEDYIYILRKDGCIVNLAQESEIAKQSVEEDLSYRFIDSDLKRLIIEEGEKNGE